MPPEMSSHGRKEEGIERQAEILQKLLEEGWHEISQGPPLKKVPGMRYYLQGLGSEPTFDCIREESVSLVPGAQMSVFNDEGDGVVVRRVDTTHTIAHLLRKERNFVIVTQAGTALMLVKREERKIRPHSTDLERVPIPSQKETKQPAPPTSAVQSALKKIFGKKS